MLVIKDMPKDVRKPFSLDFYFKCGDGTRSCLVSLKSIKYFLIKQAGKAGRADLEMERSCERGFGSP